MLKNNEFNPNWFSPPGETIRDILEERNLTVSDFSQKMGDKEREIRELLLGNTLLTIALARKLEANLGGSVSFWMTREFQYRQDLARFQENHGTVNREWLKEIPTAEMIKLGWINRLAGIEEKVSECLRFFGVSTVEEWREVYKFVLGTAAFRTSPSFTSQPGAVAAWLRRGEIECGEISCAPWDAKQFTKTLLVIRSLTRERNPIIFLPELKRLCGECGVAVVVVRAPSGCKASGATRFLSSEKALLVLSSRYLSDDHFWFSFFHEAAHLLLHGKKAIFLEGQGNPASIEEKEANEFAFRILIPPKFEPSLRCLPCDGRKVIRFAREIGLSPGIVVGQLQHLGHFKSRQLNNLKRRFHWDDVKGLISHERE